jgi:uncharacterized protein YndB with AHSA1/START domain
MTATQQETGTTADREIVLTRAFDAPRALVFQMWTDPQHMPQWWGPRGYSITLHEMDVRPGGLCRFLMHGPDGTAYPNRQIYREVVANERLVFDHGWDKDDGPDDWQVTVTFEDVDGQTLVTQRSVFRTAAQRAEVVAFGAVELGQQTLAKCAEYLATL